MIEYQHEKHEEQKAWEMWLMRYQNMDKSNFMTFSEFYKDLTTKKVSEKSSKEILQSVYNIRRKIAPKGR